MEAVSGLISLLISLWDGFAGGYLPMAVVTVLIVLFIGASTTLSALRPARAQRPRGSRTD